mgnify:CR=1 FL=1
MRLGLLASGRGSNADAILTAIAEGRLEAEAALLLCDREAGALDVAERHGLPARNAPGNAASRTSTSWAATTMARPMPMLKTRYISSASTAWSRAMTSNTGGTGQAPMSKRAPTASGRTRGMFSSSPPPVMCATTFVPGNANAAANSE